jgi:hypothetical protein
MDPDVVLALVVVVEKLCCDVRNTRTGFAFVSENVADVPPVMLAVTL